MTILSSRMVYGAIIIIVSMQDFKLQFTLQEPVRKVQRLSKEKAVPRVTEFMNPAIENPMEHLVKLGLVSSGESKSKDTVVKEAVEKARDAVAGYAQSNGARKAVEALAEAVEQVL